MLSFRVNPVLPVSGPFPINGSAPVRPIGPARPVGIYPAPVRPIGPARPVGISPEVQTVIPAANNPPVTGTVMRPVGIVAPTLAPQGGSFAPQPSGAPPNGAPPSITLPSPTGAAALAPLGVTIPIVGVTLSESWLLLGAAALLIFFATRK